MKVLFAGTAGIQKSTAVSNLLAAVHRDFRDDRVFTVKERNGRETIPILDHILYGSSPIAFLQQPEETQKRKWREAFAQIRNQFDGARNEHHFLGVHLTYRFEQVPSCIASFADLIEWRPDCIVTFIDDAYCVRQRIHNGGYTSFTLAELVLWRSEEVLVGDLLARVIDPKRPPPNYVVAVKHPSPMVARMLLQKPTARIYLSHDISAARRDPSLRKAIDIFRRKLRDLKNCAVFEPLAIDELPPVLKFPKNIKGSRRYDPKRIEDRWPTLNRSALLATDADLANKYPLHIPWQELRDVRNAIDAQVERRDIRLVEQSHCMLVYRPTLAGEAQLSTGVNSEVRHARATGRRIIWYIKKGDDPVPTSPFAPQNPGDDPDFIYDKNDKRLWERLVKIHEDLDPDRDHFLR